MTEIPPKKPATTPSGELPSARLSDRGQITLPKHVRQSLGVGPGDKVYFYENLAGHTVIFAKNRSAASLAGVAPTTNRRVSIEEMDEAIASAVVERVLGKSAK